ncbi:hypothetical protein KC19_VG214500 [Ceratodon purpureus]|uniref:Uncharacterized protein n=1 Tax=Ceratodon purpureus TaxID=3225 RepID=A0A8T0HSZ3_CERPU|nr:hypothetical protein KC19_VG214500 [Ceratodon purpureus]
MPSCVDLKQTKWLSRWEARHTDTEEELQQTPSATGAAYESTAACYDNKGLLLCVSQPASNRNSASQPELRNNCREPELASSCKNYKDSFPYTHIFINILYQKNKNYTPLSCRLGC